MRRNGSRAAGGHDEGEGAGLGRLLNGNRAKWERPAFAIVVLATLVGCGAANGSPGGSRDNGLGMPGSDAGAAGDTTTVRQPCSVCASYGAIATLGPVPAGLRELSGLAASWVYPNVLYGHNDSANTPRFFAISIAGGAPSITAEFHLAGAHTDDWEAIAVGPCGGGAATSACIYIADIGDNDLMYDEHAIYRLAEPSMLPTVPTAPVDRPVLTPTFERFPFRYPDGRHNAETLLVHPATGDIFIVTKTEDIPAVYKFPAPLVPDQVVTLTLVTSLTLPPTTGRLTDGSFHPCAPRVMLRSSNVAYELSASAGAGTDGGADALFAQAPLPVPLPVEAQGESIAYLPDGRGYITGTEVGGGSPPATLSTVACSSPAP